MPRTSTPTDIITNAVTVVNAIRGLHPFMGRSQLRAIGDALRGEERKFFQAKMVEMAAVVAMMPKTYETDGTGDNALVHLHYFKGGMDWYITEKDAGSPDDAIPGQQTQAFGLACMGEDELGYVSITELIANHVELDLFWRPKTLREVMRGRRGGA